MIAYTLIGIAWTAIGLLVAVALGRAAVDRTIIEGDYRHRDALTAHGISFEYSYEG